MRPRSHHVTRSHHAKTTRTGWNRYSTALFPHQLPLVDDAGVGEVPDTLEADEEVAVVAAADGVEALDSDLADPDFPDVSVCFSSVFLADPVALLPPPLKSVTYQPPPFN